MDSRFFGLRNTRDLASAHDEPLRGMSDEIEGIASHKGQRVFFG